jgi:cell division protein FtsZ
MGKAMMGTGEASGEKRALRSAEAAIANPLIDDVSMKGARGLLISITGGKDLTLYEVDEAATRIREEVDQEANIIVGATFDETLEGIIRVSVVATGIDTIAHAQRPPADNNRLAELTQRLRVDTQRIAAERVEHVQTHAQVQPPQARATPPAPVAPPVAAPAAQPPAPRPSFEHAATAAVAAALQPQSTIDDVTVRSISPKPSLFVEPVMAEPAPQDMPKSFIPPEPERARAPRMPRIDELPMPAQNQLRARQGEPADVGPEKQRMSLLQRLAQVGLGRRDDSEAHAEAPAPTHAERPALPPLPPRQPPRMPDPVSEYAKRPQAPAAPQGAAHQGLDIHGRQALPVHKSVDDDQLEIPAFLRRQAN